MARLVVDQPNDWVLKGGLALQFRLGDRARTTKDIDLLLVRSLAQMSTDGALIRAGSLNLADGFQFDVARPSSEGELRFHVRSLLDGRPFESFHVDVGTGDPLVEPPEKLTAPAFLGAAARTGCLQIHVYDRRLDGYGVVLYPKK